MISLATVEITRDVKRNLDAAIKEGRIGQGRFIKLFEQKFATYIGTKYAVFVSNGTVADTLALCAIKDKMNEVIVPAFTFVAQVNAIIHAGLQPVFVDVDTRGQMNPDMVRRVIHKKTLAIFPAHLLGRVADIEALKALADKHHVYLIEDCCEALGAMWKKKKVGAIGDIGTFSFYASHHITTGEGGMITTNDKKIYDTLVAIRNHGRKSDDIQDVFTFEQIGFNAKGTNLQAAIGAALVDAIEDAVLARRQHVSYLNSQLSHSWYSERKHERSSPHGFPVSYGDERDRDAALDELYSAGIEARKLMASIPNPKQCPAYSFMNHKAWDFPMADFFGSRWLYVPCHQLLRQKDLDVLVAEIEKTY